VSIVPLDRSAITAHVCGNTISLPKGVSDDSQESYDLFQSAMFAAMDSKSFNTL